MATKPRFLMEKDSFIMEHVLKSTMSKSEISMANRMRLYLQVETVVEVANPDGTRTDPAWLAKGENLHGQPSNSLEWGIHPKKCGGHRRQPSSLLPSREET